MIVLDASVLIAYLDGADAQHARAVSLLADAVDDELAVNPVTLAEVLAVPARTGRLDQVTDALRDLEVNELPFPAESAARLARFRVTTGLRMPDCCVLLAADDADATVASFDERLARGAEDCDLPVRRG